MRARRSISPASPRTAMEPLQPPRSGGFAGGGENLQRTTPGTDIGVYLRCRCERGTRSITACPTPKYMRVQVSRRKRARVGASTITGDWLRAQFPNHLAALDFAFDQTAEARVLNAFIVNDEFTKAARAIEVELSVTRDHFVRILDRLAAVLGHLRFIRMNNGPEMTCHAIADRSFTNV